MFLNVRCFLMSAVISLSIVRGTLSGTLDTANAQYKEKIIRISKSAEMRNYLNESFDPCENFYDFACGNYYTLNEPYLPPYQNNAFETISKGLRRKFSTLLNEVNAADTPTDRKVKDFYKSCMALKTSPRIYGNKFKEIISEFGQMPIVAGDKWRDSSFDWLQLVGKIFHRYGFRIILGCHIDVDITNSTVNRLRLVYQDIPLESKSVYTDAVHADIRHSRQIVIAKRLREYFGVDSKLAEKAATQIFEFESELFAGEDEDEDDDNDDDNTTEKSENADDDDDDDDFNSIFQNLTTIEEMQTKYYAQLDIKRLVSISLGGYIPTGEVYDYLAADFEHVSKVLLETPKQILANYIFFYVLENFMLSVAQDQKDTILQEITFTGMASFQLHHMLVIRCPTTVPDLCIKETKQHFAKVMDNMVYRKYTTRQTEQDVKYMWETIKTAFHNVLKSDKLTWMKDETRSYALEKLSAMKMEINSYENTNLTEEFHPLHINKEDYIENMKAIFAFQALQLREKLNQTATGYDNPEVLSFTPVYVVTENAIKVPVSILQPYYLWSDYYPNALKFGTLGFLMSHELIHGFDEEGRFFDKSGNIRKWWDTDSSNYFKNHTECFSKQYHGYIYNGHFLPKLDTQSENIADNGGIRLAYEAYLKWYEDTYRTYQKTDIESLPRLNYTSKQLFFISYAQLWCSATHEVLRDFAASTDDHVPDKIRVIGPLANFEEFSKEFKCPRGSFMNPLTKCSIY